MKRQRVFPGGKTGKSDREFLIKESHVKNLTHF